MRRDGDRLLELLSNATKEVLICVPFIKVGVLARLLGTISAEVRVRIVTRWLAREVAAGVSDLEVLEIVQGRAETSLELLDRLHAKIYIADRTVLVGSANLTGPALGWAAKPNLELLTGASLESEDIQQCLSALAEARPATAGERDRVRAESEKFQRIELAEDAAADSAPTLWLPRSGAPDRLYQAYVPQSRDRLSRSVLEATTSDLEALGIPAGLSESDFTKAVAEAFQAMPAIRRLLDAADDDLNDEEGIKLIGEMLVNQDLTPRQQWLMVRDWMTTFLAERYEIAPASFIIRRRPKRSA